MPARKTVTVLFCDVTGSTELGETLDPEALQTLLARYFERMQEIVERHGGTVEKFIGDAVVAVFGVPVAHEDDALRAVRAAVEMRDAFPNLGLRGRIGVNTGEVVAGTAERLVTGDAVNVAARFQQAAEPGEILIGAPTRDLLAGAVELEELEPLPLKGKAEPVPAYRLLRVTGTPERRHSSRFVGRERELGALRAALRRAADERRCELVTVIADAGVGKSRLVAEFLAAAGARVARGRCLPYGDGITYWPLVDVLKDLAVMPAEETAQAVVRMLLGETALPVSTDEIAWAVRKTIEQAAADAPLAVVFDDIQWGEESFLDLIEHIALMSAGAPILLICMARPELLDRRPQWQVAIRLEPLPLDAAQALIPDTLDDALRERIVHAASGNPLFITEMVAMSAEAGGEVVVPPTLKALLAARLDQLDPQERGVLERGSVEGELFHRGAVQALGGGEPLLPRLTALVRKELIRPDAPQLPGEDGFRFRHLLIRDAAYDALAKRDRADLHVAFADWLQEHGRELPELDEILGYHYEQAHRYRQELGVPDDGVRAAALTHLRAVEQRVMLRQDYRVAQKLTERCLALVPAGEVDGGLEIDRMDSYSMTGNMSSGLSRLMPAHARAVEIGNSPAALAMEMTLGTWQLLANSDMSGLTELVDRVLPQMEATHDDLALQNGYWAAGWVAINSGRPDDALVLLRKCEDHARRVNPHTLNFARRLIAGSLLSGTASAGELLDFVDGWERDRGIRVDSMSRASALCRLGRLDESRDLGREIVAEFRERGNSNDLGGALVTLGLIELLAGDTDAALDLMSESREVRKRSGVMSGEEETVTRMALILCDLGRLDEAEEHVREATALIDPTDLYTEISLRRARAELASRRGDHAAAIDAARAAVRLAEQTQYLEHQAEAYATLGDVLTRAGQPSDAGPAYEQALARFERKENLLMAERISRRMWPGSLPAK